MSKSKQKEKINPSLEDITNALKKIEWSVEENGNGIECYYIINHKGENTGMQLWHPKTNKHIIYKVIGDSMPSVYFYLKDTVLKFLPDEGAFSISGVNNKDIFILFANYDRIRYEQTKTTNKRRSNKKIRS